MNNETNVKSADEIKPYPGLRCFQYKENFLFFGREGKAQEIASRLQNSHFMAVVGTSGSGKSSLVRAGLLPLLYGGMLYESGSHWRIAIMRPEETPIHNLAEALTYPVDFETEENGNQPRDENQISITEGTLRRSGVGLLDFIKNPANNFDEDENLLVVVDQFEELFRFKEKSSLEDTEEAAAFVKLLLEATRDKQSRIFVVITMRSDFLGDCAEFRDLPEAINDGQYLIPRMTRDQLRQSIESPAFVGDAQVSPALVNRLLNDLEDQNQALDVGDRIVKDHLPVLQHALMRTWDLWKEKGETDKPLDIAHYEDEVIGGMAHALSRHANEAFDDLDDNQKALAEKMFRCLTETDSENRETRRPAKIEEICAVTGVGEEEIYKIVDVFRQEKKGRTFLMPPEGVELTKETKIDISHESLIRNWEILKAWVKDEAKDAWIYRRISQAALILREYEDDKKGKLEPEEFERNCKDFLWRGIELEAALKWRETFKPNVNWASRYQALTEKEKLELRQLSRTAPKSEPLQRWEFIQLHFDKTTEFLDKSAKNEAAIQAEKERIQQERIAYAEQLALVEQEKVEGLRNLTASLKRQRRFLFVVSALSILLTIASWLFYSSANRAKAEALTQRLEAINQKNLAESRKTEADDQRIFAESQKTEAERQQDIAEDERKKALEQTEIAESQKTEAEKQKKIADAEKINAEAQKEKVEAAQTQLLDSNKSLTAKEIELNKTIAKNALNLEGLAAYENYDFEKAKTYFEDLEKLHREAKSGDEVEGVWWAQYNIAKSNQQLGNFEAAKQAYQSALATLPPYKLTTETSNLQQFSPVSFITASYKSELPPDDATLKESRIITLRKFAQFYRNCAANPDDCFDNYSPGESVAYNSTDAQQLYMDAIALYLELLEIKERRSGGSDLEKDKIFLADVKTELADAYYLTYRDKEAEDYYQAALSVYEQFGAKKTLTDISIRKKLLEAKLGLTKYDEADREADTIIRKKTEFLVNLHSRANNETSLEAKAEIDKKIAHDRSIGVIYGELAALYRKYAEAELKKFHNFLNIELDNIKETVDTRTKQSYPNTSQKPPAETADEDKIKKDFLNGLGNLIYESEKRDTSQFSVWEKSVFEKMSVYADIYKRLTQKEQIFSGIALPLAEFNTDDNRNSPEARVRTYITLVEAYIKMGDVKKTELVITDYYNYVEEHFSQNKSKYAENRLEMLKVLSYAYQYSKDYCKAAAISSQWSDEFERQFPNQSNYNEARKYIYYYSNAAVFYSQCGDCPESYVKRRELHTRVLKYIESNDANIPENPNETGLDKGYATKIQIESALSIARTYESEGNAGETIKTYEALLAKILRWQKNNQISQNQNPANDNRANANVAVPTPSPTPPNMNAMMTNNKDSKSRLNKVLSFYESYVHVRLAELHFDKDAAKAKNLPVKYTQKFTAAREDVGMADSTLIILKYGVSSKNIGDLLKQKDKEQALRYYQSSVEAFESFIEYSYSYTSDASLEEYFANSLPSKKFYSEYIAALKSLKELKGDALELDKKIGSLEEALKKAPLAQVREKTKCPSGQ